MPCLGAALRCPAWARVVPCLGAGCPLAEANPGRRREEPGAWDPVLAWRPALSPCLPACPGRPALRAHLGSEVANGALCLSNTKKNFLSNRSYYLFLIMVTQYDFSYPLNFSPLNLWLLTYNSDIAISTCAERPKAWWQFWSQIKGDALAVETHSCV